MAKTGKATVVLGTQWGDEGKGKIVDILSSKFPIVARFGGGANAGHTIYVGKEKYIFHLLPSGILHPRVMSVLGHGMVINLETLMKEITNLEKKGYKVDDRLLISNRAHVLMPFHVKLDEYIEESKGKSKVGTTKRGIGPAYVDKAARQGIRAVDLLDKNLLIEKLETQAKTYREMYGIKVSPKKLYNKYKPIIKRLGAFITDTGEYLRNARAKGKNILIEGAQGTFLDIDYGMYPFVTSSTTTIGGSLSGLGLPWQTISEVIGVMKAYTTRVGGGPFPSELLGKEGNKLREAGGEFGSTTGRPRRCGWFDVVVGRNAVEINGLNYINLTKVDVLDYLKTIKIAVSYKLDGKEIKNIPASLKQLKKVKVKYIEVPGWQKDISKCRSFNALPINCQNYIKKLEKLVGCSIKYIGVGQERKAMITKR